MAFGVRKWPSSSDPRTAAWSVYGWNYGEVAPFTWLLKTTDATGPFARYNTAVPIFGVSSIPNFTTFREPGYPTQHFSGEILITGWQTPQGSPPGYTIRISINLLEFGAAIASGSIDQLFPQAIAVQPPITVVPFTGVGGTIPNPMTITPAKWNYS